MSLAQDYLNDHDGRAVDAATAFALDLMRGDPESFKAGYSAMNAAMAADEVFDLTSVEYAEVLDRIDPLREAL